MIPTQRSRLLALDIMRGITIAGMILVNNPGGKAFAPLDHSIWNGLTPTDLIFPFFMFIMGVSTYFSLRKYNCKLSTEATFKILKRTIIIFTLGLIINSSWKLCVPFLDFTSSQSLSERALTAFTSLEHIRILGVLQRLALTYCGASFIFLLFRQRYILLISILLLLIYGIILNLGNGFDISENNIINIIDRYVLGTSHLYKDWSVQPMIIFDPEGLLSTLPGISNVLIGLYIGRIIINNKDNHVRIEKMFVMGTILLFIGYLLSYEWAINKKIWSPTFVLITCGAGSLLLGLLIWIIDINNQKRWTPFFESFGVNPLFTYLLADVLAVLFATIKFSVSGKKVSIASTLIHGFSWLPEYWSSLGYSIFFILLIWLLSLYLYKKHIYIKI